MSIIQIKLEKCSCGYKNKITLEFSGIKFRIDLLRNDSNNTVAGGDYGEVLSYYKEMRIVSKH